MNKDITRLDTIKSIFRMGYRSYQLDFPIEDCPYEEGLAERFFWEKGWRCAASGCPLESVFSYRNF